MPPLAPIPPVATARIIGVMSGTSADGVDAALCEFPPHRSFEPGGWGRLLTFASRPYPARLQDRIHRMRRVGHTSLREIAEVTRELTLVHAEVVRDVIAQSGLDRPALTAVADHGQTVFHAPPVTMQLLDPSLLAWETGVPVLSDFRRADCAAGGQGAPLVPYADLQLFAYPDRTRVVLNLGGIANLTILRPGWATHLAFDTGPANCLSDHLCRSHDPSGPGFDPGGAQAATGRVWDEVVGRFLSDTYFRSPPPKSTDGPAMIAAWEAAVGSRNLPLPDLLATATECAARAVAAAVTPLGEVDLIVSGGGTRHGLLMRRLAALCPDARVLTSDAVGVPSEAKEAIAFALLGLATLRGEPGNVPTATGASRPVVLGSWTPVP